MSKTAFIVPTPLQGGTSAISKWGLSQQSITPSNRCVQRPRSFQITHTPTAVATRPPKQKKSLHSEHGEESNVRQYTTSSDSFSTSTTSTTTIVPAPTTGLFSTTANSFAALGLSMDMVECLKAEDIDHPTAIQSRAIPPILGGASVIVGAATGSGKTYAYLLPIVQMLKQEEELRKDDDEPIRVRRRPRCIILVPTRELAEQVMLVTRNLSRSVKFRAVCAVGGGSGASADRKLMQKIDNSSNGAIDVLICTTGRLIQLIDNRLIDIRFTNYLVIDEVDTMFDAGFSPQVQKILALAGSQSNSNEENDENNTKNIQLIAAGATHPKDAITMYDKFFHNSKKVNVDLHLSPVGLEQRFIRVLQANRLIELQSLIQNDLDNDSSGTNKTCLKNGCTMVFCNTVDSCRFVTHFLEESGLHVFCAHGDMPASRRELEWNSFRSNQGIIVCTDMVGRGLDHTGVNHVILFDFPNSAIEYVHRAGRTARAGRKGKVTSLVTKKDEGLARALEKAAKTRVDALASEEEARKAIAQRKKQELEAKRERELMENEADEEDSTNNRASKFRTERGRVQSRRGRSKRFNGNSGVRGVKSSKSGSGRDRKCGTCGKVRGRSGRR